MLPTSLRSMAHEITMTNMVSGASFTCFTRKAEADTASQWEQMNTALQEKLEGDLKDDLAFVLYDEKNQVLNSKGPGIDLPTQIWYTVHTSANAETVRTQFSIENAEKQTRAMGLDPQLEEQLKRLSTQPFGEKLARNLKVPGVVVNGRVGFEKILSQPKSKRLKISEELSWSFSYEHPKGFALTCGTRSWRWRTEEDFVPACANFTDQRMAHLFLTTQAQCHEIRRMWGALQKSDLQKIMLE